MSFKNGRWAYYALTAVLAMSALPANADTAKTYAQTCGVCHDSGSLNAPKKGDKATWDKLKAQKGMDKLVKSTRDGMPQMPKKGLCNQCTDQDFRDLIEYMSK